ncbi:hypothetical protein [Clostridium sp. BSD9I1]|uniref:hypothetical protein n=1 Tax=Clostridium sp. BSD9I1 TaxID=2003589 RepID=UPI0016483C7B|nr:hypothetical protein [Clostridium sp. BSD9I1]
MNSKILMSIILLGFIIIGLIKIICKIHKYIQDYNFVNEYALKLSNTLKGNIKDGEYTYILNNITKLSDTMGDYGNFSYKPPFANYIYNNYSIIDIILNYNGGITNEELNLALKATLIYLGECNNKIERSKDKLKNPLILFAEGFRFVFNIPLFMLNSLGIISANMYHKIKHNVVYYFIQNMISLIGFISSVIGMIQEKEVLMNIYNSIIQGIVSIF